MNWNGGRLVSITGGTTGIPKLVVHDEQKWLRAIETKSEYLGLNHVGKESRVLVCFPMAPWAIGPIFTSSAIQRGATVLPIGLCCTEQQVLGLIQEFRPNVLCGGARVLWRLGNSAKGYLEANAGVAGENLKIFTAGELLMETIRLSLSQLWGAEVLDVYGSAEHDMVAGEFAPRKGFLLAPAYEYNLVSADKQILSPSPGMTGSLAIRRRGQVEWSLTPDRILVLEKATEVEGWSQNLPFKLLGRADLTASTPDGAVLTEGHVAEIASRIGASAIQVLVDQWKDRTRMLFCCVFQGDGLDVALETLEDEVKILSADLGDSIKFGCLQLSIKNAKIDQLELTACGKLKPIIERWQDGDNCK